MPPTRSIQSPGGIVFQRPSCVSAPSLAAIALIGHSNLLRPTHA
jgi:hypothetical protein